MVTIITSRQRRRLGQGRRDENDDDVKMEKRTKEKDNEEIEQMVVRVDGDVSREIKEHIDEMVDEKTSE